MAPLSHDLNPEMVASVSAACPVSPAVSAFKDKLAGSSDAARVDAAARDVLGAYGVGLMTKTMALGEQSTDQTYEMVKAAAKKTGRLFFPHVAQRFLEIAYLATQPSISGVDVIESNHYRMVNHTGPECAIFQEVKSTCGEGIATQMPCKHVCLGAMEHLYDALNLDVAVTQESSLADDGHCRFVAANNQPHMPTPWRARRP